MNKFYIAGLGAALFLAAAVGIQAQEEQQENAPRVDIQRLSIGRADLKNKTMDIVPGKILSAATGKEISDYVAELEKEIISGTDEEPRQYQPEKRKEKDFVPPQIIEESWEELPKIKGVEKIQQETENNKEEAITEDEPEFSSEENSKEKFDEKPENFSEQNEKFEDEPEFKEKQDNEVLDIF